MLPLAGCGETEAPDTCIQLQHHLDRCRSGCPEQSACALTYETLRLEERAKADGCTLCLASEATSGTCRECDIEGTAEPCAELLSRWFDLPCLLTSR